MKTRAEVIEFLQNLIWKRMYRQDLQRILGEFFETDNLLEDSTETEDESEDESFVFTNATERYQRHGFIDVQIWYITTRDRRLFITGTQMLSYQD